MGLIKADGGPGGGRAAAVSLPGGMDLSILSTVAAPDPLAQQKYEAMGLPDPVAFAALAALGAIPNPMDMLNKMMLAAQERIDEANAASARLRHDGGASPAAGSPRAAPPAVSIPPGKSFLEAFQDLQQQRLQPQPGAGAADLRRDAADLEARRREAQQSREAAFAQAKRTAERAKEAAQLNRDSEVMRSVYPRDAGKDISNVFSAAGDDDAADGELGAGGKQQLGTTLSSLLTGRQSTQDPFGPLASAPGVAPRHLCVGGLPRGTAESIVRLECARHGAVSSVILEPDGCTAYVTFAASDMAASAAAGLASRTGLFGCAADVGLQIRLMGEIPDSIRLAAALPPVPPEEPADPAQLPEYLRPREDRKKKRSRSRSRGRKKRSRSRKRRARSRSMVRWLDRSRSNSHTATGQYIRATGCSSTVRWWEKKRADSSSSSSSSHNKRRRQQQREAAAEAEKRRPKQVAVKGPWAQFAQNGKEYYYNLLTGRTTWEKPGDFDKPPSTGRPTSCFL